MIELRWVTRINKEFPVGDGQPIHTIMILQTRERPPIEELVELVKAGVDIPDFKWIDVPEGVENE